MLLPYEWRDFIEIFLFIFLFYRLIHWLNDDPNKKIILYFLGYCIFFIGAYWIQLITICAFLILYTPVIMLFFVIFHQKSLQKNFIAKINPVQTYTYNSWIEHVISTGLYLLNNNIDTTILIEHTQTLHSFLHNTCPLEAPISTPLLRMITSSQFFNPKNMLWITSNGFIKGINTTWKNNDPDQETNLITYTDALVLKIEHTSHSFSLLVQGHHFTNLSAEHVTLLLKQYSCFQSNNVSQGFMHEKKQSREIS